MKNFLLKTSFLTIICLSFFSFAYFFTQTKNAKLDLIEKEAKESSNIMELALEKDTNYIRIFKSIGENFLKNNKEIDLNNSSLNFDLIKNTNNNTYNMDEVIVKNLHKELGNLTGKGNYLKDKELIKEIGMALNFNSVFKDAWDNSKDLTWIYYTSAKNFINVYPWISSEEFSFNKEIYKKEFYYRSLPENNPNRDLFWTDLYLDEADQGAMVTVSAPIYYKDIFKGVVSLDVTTKTLSYELLKKSYNNSIKTIIVNKNGKILGYSNFNKKMEKKILNINEILPNSLNEIHLKKLNPLKKTIKLKNYFLVKKSISGVPWDLYAYESAQKVYWESFLSISPMLIITLSLLLLYYELYQKKEAEKKLRRIVKKLRKTKTQLEAASKTDPLTELLNRRGITEEILKEQVRYKKTKKNFSLIMCDIDYFKKINDTYGHDCGDYVLKNVAQLMTMNIKEQDFIGRWGGEEFVIMLIETDYDIAMEVAERLRKAIEKFELNYQNTKLKITMTFGVSNYDHNMNLEVNISSADMALYQGKNSGRNTVVGNKSIN